MSYATYFLDGKSVAEYFGNKFIIRILNKIYGKYLRARIKNNIYWFRSKQEKQKNQLDLSDYQGEKSKNVWKIRPVAPQENLHPCPFPLELAERIIEFYSYIGDYVIDIFTGSGQTNIAAEKLQRRHIGIETQQRYIDYAIERFNLSFAQMEFL